MTNAERNDGEAEERLGARTVLLSRNGTPKSLLVRKYKLLIASGSDQGREVTIDSDTFSIGAGAECDLVIRDAHASRRHCEILSQPQGFLLRDLNSTNGTLVHGVRVCEAFLTYGTEFQCGTTRLIFCPLQEMATIPLSPRESLGRLQGVSVAMRRVFHLAETYAPTDAAILIQGETGTGKELLAEAIHEHSRRHDKPFVVIDCSSLAKGVVESELFGHMKGAFTGATAERTGAFEEANGGTVFLDEIGELDLELQPKLLRVLERKEVRRLGSNTVRRINVRVIVASNRNLEKEVREGRFREDLFYRLSVVRIELPPLRKRPEDIPMLMKHFMAEFAVDAPDQGPVDVDKAMEAMGTYDWPGNVRELRNLVEFAMLGRSGRIDFAASLFSGRLRTASQEGASQAPTASADEPFKDAKGKLVEQFEKDYVRALLDKNGGNISKAAREARIERAYLQRLIKKHGMNA